MSNSYPSMFERNVEDTGTRLDENDPFLQAFRKEMCISLIRVAEIDHALQGIAVDQKSDVVSMRRSEIERHLSGKSPPIGAGDLAQFLRAFGLIARDSWDAIPPPPYTRSDIWPWLFERRLSLMLKPVLVIAKDDDPLLIYGVRQIDMGVRYASILLETGNWPREKLTSDQARSYVDAEGNRRELAFQSEIAELVREAGWNAMEAIPMRRLGAPKQLGDLDVLAISSNGGHWWVMECKWFGAARTPREIASWLQDFRGRPGDKLDRHLQRVAWIMNNQSSVLSSLGLSRLPESINASVVTTSPVPLQLVVNLPPGSNVVTRRQLKNSLSSTEFV